MLPQTRAQSRLGRPEGSLPGRGEVVCCTAWAEGMRPPQTGGKARKGEDGPLKDFGGRKDEA